MSCTKKVFNEYLVTININQVKQITKIHGLKYLDWVICEKKDGQTTANNHLAKLKQLFGHLKDRGEVKVNPFIEIIAKPAEAEGKWPFKPHQRKILKEILEVREPELWMFIKFIFYMFIRPGELRMLRLENINLDEATITIPGNVSKNKKTQTIAIPDVLISAIYDLNIHTYEQNFFIFSKKGKPGATPIGINSMNYKHSKILKEKGFSDKYSIYSWK